MAAENRWWVQFRGRDKRWECSLSAYWEVAGDPISDNYTPDEISAPDLLALWAKRYRREHKGGLVPIHWFVQSDAGQFETMPFAYNHFGGKYQLEDFLHFYRWPVHAVSGQPLNWLSLPVVDKLWNEQGGDKGGFIQEATGWKPSILQPFVYLPSLLDGPVAR